MTILMVLTLISAPFSGSFSSDEEKKVKPRISVDYYKVMEEGRYLSIKALARGEKGYDPAAKLNIDVYQNLLDSTILLGSVITNSEGKAIFNLDNLNTQFENDTLGILMSRQILPHPRKEPLL